MSNTEMLVHPPHASHASARAAGGGRRFMETLPARLDRLVEAALLEEWDEVRRLSEVLLERAQEYDYPELAECAAAVAREAARSANELGIKRSIVRLVSSCGKPQLNRPRKTACAC